MYTQCPECSTAFRVTAAVLRQAAGKVRCGGCGIAFNALAHLSEEKPVSRPVEKPPESDLPELKPEPLEAAAPAEPPPTAISPEQSAALLKTLDDLAGSDIRLEDTGIEWRLLDDDDEGGDPAAPGASVRASLLDEELSADLESRHLDEVLSNTPTPVDEYLPAAGDTAVESAEVFDEAASQTIPDEELRFDDNTGLPDEFDEETGERPLIVPEPTRDAPEPMANQQVDLGFGDPDDWLDLLEEVSPEGADDPRAVDEAVAADDDDTDDDTDSGDNELSSRMEALSLELSGIQEELDELSGSHGIIDEQDPASPDEGPDDGFVLEADDDEDTILVPAPDEEAGPDGEPDAEDAGDEIVLEAGDSEDDEFLLDADDESGPDDPLLEVAADDDDDDSDNEIVLEADDDDDSDNEIVLEADDDDDSDDEIVLEADDDDDDTSIDDDLLAAAFESEAVISRAEPAAHVVPPLTEEEQTINMMIDQDLLSIAVEDEDGFASTIVGDKASFDAALAAAEAEAEAAGADTTDDRDAVPVETIIMEGAIARSAAEEALAEAAKNEAPQEANSQQDATRPSAGVHSDEGPTTPTRNWRLVAGVIVLALLLAAQAVHFSRESLARVPAIYDLLAPVYDTIGMPLTPAWEVTGWRFEATRGSTNEAGDTLSIFTRIGNESAAALPYPVISVSLTDRFEETIGSRVFEPPEYLAGDVDTRHLVAAGSTFDALMAIESPVDAATGFKLNVCYRQAGDRLRCAIEDFR